MRAIDLFAGAGGFSTGAEMAGCEVVWAANHWPEAVAVHWANHPKAEHACQDLQQADFTMLPAYDLLLASPACQGHSRARGKERPHHDAQRATAWAVVSALEAGRPEAAVIENVPEFLDWALYAAWREAIRALGYSVAEYVVDAADHGAPQNRRRAFIVLTRSRNPIVLDLPRREHVGAVSFVDFDTGRWSRVDKPGRAENTLARIRQGRKVHGDRFLIAYYGNEKGGRSLSRPIGTITTRDRWAIVDGERMRMINVEEARKAMTFPDSYVLPNNSRDAMKMLGNAVCPVAARDVISAIRRRA